MRKLDAIPSLHKDPEKTTTRNICELFQDQAQKTPLAIAVKTENSQTSYQELDLASNRLANYLIKCGVRAETLVGVCLGNNLHLIVSLLGILKAGGAYLPLDPSYPPERLKMMIEDSAPTILLTESIHEHLFTNAPGRVLFLDRLHQLQENQTPQIQIDPDHLAYVFYTSGTTGKPKGIMVNHRSCPHIAASHSDFYPDNLIALVSGAISFDVSLLILFHVLCHGGTLALFPQEFNTDPDKVMKFILTHSINFMVSVPAFYGMLLQKSQPFPLLKSVSLTGENLPGNLVHLHAKLAPNAFLYNEYGPTEYAIGTSIAPIYDPRTKTIYPITAGKPLQNTIVSILDEDLHPLPAGSKGEICMGGIGLARGYLNNLALTEEKFVWSALGNETPVRLYRSGDLGRMLPNGEIEFLGRKDHQVKIRGHRVELSEIEQTICSYPSIKEAAVLVHETGENKRLVAYFSSDSLLPLYKELQNYLLTCLPKYMIPSAFVQIEQFPLTPNGKIDRRLLPERFKNKEVEMDRSRPASELEQILLQIWKKLLQQDEIGVHHNFFDLGGDSILVASMQTLIQEALHVTLPVVEIFQFPTISQLAQHLSKKPLPEKDASSPLKTTRESRKNPVENAIAIVGMSGRFPGSDNPHDFWKNLCEGAASISHLSSKASALCSQHVNAMGVLQGVEFFDPDFFEISAAEAAIMDPQHRLFLECSWEAMENAGYCSDHYSGSIGVYGGTGSSSYFLHHIYPNQELREKIGHYLLHINNEKDFLTTRVSYKLHLKGPSLCIQTACSTSLVAVCTACNHLLTYQCDMALAGGVAVSLPQAGYKYQEGMIFSPDGCCKPFDASSQGTVPGNGVGVVLLKRLEDAQADRDHIYAIIRGYGLNNDGREKIGYSAPSVQGQKDAIESAIAMAEINPETISYAEAHGTGTLLGDPIEVTALTKAFAKHTEKKGFCSIGSVKSNIGHLIEAAGIASLIKTTFALKEQLLPPLLHATTPNPNIDFPSTPFYLSHELKKWTASESPRRACVSSFGIGGTNAHVILEEPPPSFSSASRRPYQLLLLSAKTAPALQTMSENLASVLKTSPSLSLADIAYTLQVGRKSFEHRRFVIAGERFDALEALLAPASPSPRKEKKPLVVFVIPGDDFLSMNRGQQLYQSEPAFRYWMDQGASHVNTLFGIDLLASAEQTELPRDDCLQFLVQFSLGKLWEEWGIRPDEILSEGRGHLVAACLRGEMTLQAALEQIFTKEAPKIGGEPLLPDDPNSLYLALSPLSKQSILPSLSSSPQQSDWKVILSALGTLWVSGCTIDSKRFYEHEQRCRVPLPSYPFEKIRCWIDPPVPVQTPAAQKNESVSLSLEESLRALWRDFLGPKPIGDHDDFFDLGGDSVLAIQVLSAIHSRFGLKLDLQDALLEFPTIAHLTELITHAAAKNASHSILVPLKPGQGNPLFLLHPIEGHVLGYKSLAQLLAFKGPVYGIRSPDRSLACCGNSIEEIASFYLKAVRTIQRAGPYRFLGFSLGGLVAYEMSRQLLASQESIDFLCLMDIAKPKGMEQIDDDLILQTKLFEFMTNGTSSTQQFTQQSPEKRIKALLDCFGLGTIPEAEQLNIYEQIQVHYRALQSYSPQPLDHPFIYIEAKNPGSRPGSFSLGSAWKGLARRGIDLYEVTGTHKTMLSPPHVAEIVKVVDAYLN